jgi:hypothetical protein
VLIEKLIIVKLVKKFPAFCVKMNIKYAISFLSMHGRVIVILPTRIGPGVSVREHRTLKNQIF